MQDIGYSGTTRLELAGSGALKFEILQGHMVFAFIENNRFEFAYVKRNIQYF